MSLLTPSKIKHVDHLDRAKFLFIWRLTLAFSILLPSLGVLFIFLDESQAYITYILGFAITFAGLLYLYFKQEFKLVFLVYSLLGSALIQLDLVLIADSHHYPNFLWMTMLIILSFYGLGKIWGIIMLILNAGASVYFLLTRMYEHYEIIIDTDRESSVLIAIEIPVIMLIISYLVHLNTKANNEIQKDLISANQNLETNNEEISKRDQEKTVLVKEIHHRVKNNLQIIISLLRLQMAEVKSSDGKQQFSEAINRVLVMSSIHQKLYRQKDISKFNLQSYIKELAIELKEFYYEDLPIEIDVETKYDDIDLKTVVPLGLILNELLSNSFKYAFAQKPEGIVRIQVEDMGTYFTMTYSDDGVWKEPSKEESGSGFGLELIDTLTEQLNGLKTVSTSQNGTKYTFEMQKLTD